MPRLKRVPHEGYKAFLGRFWSLCVWKQNWNWPLGRRQRNGARGAVAPNGQRRKRTTRTHPDPCLSQAALSRHSRLFSVYLVVLSACLCLVASFRSVFLDSFLLSLALNVLAMLVDVVFFIPLRGSITTTRSLPTER